MSQPRSTIHGGRVGLTAFVAGLTSPYTALALPLIGAFGSQDSLGTASHPILQRTQTKLIGWLCSGIALLPAYFYYVKTARVAAKVFSNRRVEPSKARDLYPPVPSRHARGPRVVPGGVSGSPYEPVHGVYLGIGLLGFAIWSVRHLNAQENGGAGSLSGWHPVGFGACFYFEWTGHC